MRKQTHEEFLSRLEEKFKGRIVVTGGAYVNNQTHIQVKCNACGLERLALPNRLLCEKGLCCPRCSGKERLTTESFKERVLAVAGHEYVVVSDYGGINRHVEMRHTSCGHQWKVTPSNFLYAGTRCPKCSHPSTRKSHDQFAKEVTGVNGGVFELVSGYSTNMTPVTLRHKKCQKEFEVIPNSFLNGRTSCPHCRKSNFRYSIGVESIRDYLTVAGIQFEEEFSLPGLRQFKAKGKVTYDFFLPDYDLIIEYDGEQHFKPYKMAGGNESFRNQHRRDLLKNEAVLNSGKYCLLRIPYLYKHMCGKLLDTLFAESSTTIETFQVLFIDGETKYVFGEKEYLGLVEYH